MEYIGYAWLGIVVACVAIEAMTVSLTTIWFAIGAIFAWLIYLTGLGLEVQIVVFVGFYSMSYIYEADCNGEIKGRKSENQC